MEVESGQNNTYGILIIFISLIFALFMIFSPIKNLINTNSKLDREKSTLLAQVDKFETKKENIESFKDDKAMMSKLDALNVGVLEILPDKDDRASLYAQLEGLIKISGVNNTEVSAPLAQDNTTATADPNAGGDLSLHELKVDLDANSKYSALDGSNKFQGLLGFLLNLEKTKRLFNVSSLDVSAQTQDVKGAIPKYDTLNTKATLSTYYKDEVQIEKQ
ncbi:hypothetical protein AUK11_00860 [bacterium CG2_30_37_16]|nr:MAG: hypothetical protein AUK11_00860 [bacterium CG2_30_37_16]PIP31199.1 MAG: hypothetical protein COX25_00645 [bacterium (Candidatus Howlettbacteria) CG23_combo_of_CG06-09_8_20_14_all_37_9]PIX98973.1 MAG: hypothetical protein COZ22_03685 [bacterium (Candidatus Howlettbacteria) CG_4_10_14_3_um_filter_37_10]PJB06454.1 MAG: hypothetical protein CO123_02155 [bacterium (Candidatus Howlettbacteria) CG_4_9_14_3_um_filter_37_10]